MSLTCPLCDKTLKAASYLEQHLQRHTGEKPFKCGICSKDFCSKAGLQRHLPRHSNKRPHKCVHPGCEKTFKTKLDLYNHQEIHKNVTRFECIFCKKPRRFLRGHSLQNHIRSHINEKVHICEICGDEKSTHRNGKEHYLWHHTDQRPFKCESCSVVFCSSGGLDHHKKTIHASTPPPKRMYSCADCKETFPSTHSLQKHRQVHTGIPKPFKCALCKKAFLSTAHLYDHMRKHTGERPYKCAVCSKDFAFVGNRNAHLKTHARNRKRHPCTECDKTYSTAPSLKFHKIRVHSPERVKECTFCDTKFACDTDLFKHLRIHISESPYICKVCGKETRQLYAAKVHYLRCHAKRRIYECGLCGNRFFSCQDLREHENKVHEGKGKRTKLNVDVENYLLFE